jgi:uncharacterized protein (TIGR02996 family)
MTDHDALLAAICAAPEEDTPRLVLADWLEENDQPDQAQFIRIQIQLARTPAWEPFAVACRWRNPDWLTGRSFRHTLPQLDGFNLEWPSAPFYRGLGYRLNIRSVIDWTQLEHRIFGRVPVGEFSLWTATLDQWRLFAASPIAAQLRRVHFMTNPIEPLRVLRETPAACGITDLYFQRSSGAGMPMVVADLLASPLGQKVSGLHFRMGHDWLPVMIEMLHERGRFPLKRFSFVIMGLSDRRVGDLLQLPILQGLMEVNLHGNPLGPIGWSQVAQHLPQTVQVVNLSGTTGCNPGLDFLAASSRMRTIRQLNLSSNPLTPRAARSLSRSPHLSELRSLDLRNCQIGERELYHLTRAKFWPNLVEIDLQWNPIPPNAVRHLLDAEVPKDLTALVLPGERFNTAARQALQKKYGDCVVYASTEALMAVNIPK